MNNFWSDPKLYISIGAVLISTIALYFTYKNNRDQNRRWDELNIGKPVFKEANIGRYRKWTKAQIDTTDFGYNNVFFLSNIDDEGNYMLPYSLVIMDTITKQIIRANQIMYTMNDVKHELKNLRLQNPIVIFKGFEPNIILENVGKTDVKELMILVENKKFNQPWVRAFSNYKPMTLPGGEKVVLPLMLNFGLSEQLPNQVFYRIKMNYEDINGNAYEKYTDIFWDTKNNTWNMGGPTDDLNPTYHAPQ